MLTVRERADILAMAARRPDAPEPLHAASDAVLDGEFTWTDVVGGQCTHPLAVNLFIPEVMREVGPVVRAATAEYRAAGRAAPPDPQRLAPEPESDEDYFAEERFLDEE